jgi:hypothetical protein
VKARIPRSFRLGISLLAAAGGCVVHTYQPLSGLHRPVVVDPTAPNFRGVHVAIACIPGELLDLSKASALCRKVGTSFENQGATVTTSVGGPEELDEDDGPLPPIDLRVELRARQVHQASHPLSWAATLVTFSLVPAISEFTFEQDVVVRDGAGFLLATDTLRGRVVHWYGFGSWASNQLLDLTVREEADEVVGDGADRDLSTDLYRQLSQTVFNAKLQADVLRAAVLPADAEGP